MQSRNSKINTNTHTHGQSHGPQQQQQQKMYYVFSTFQKPYNY